MLNIDSLPWDALHDELDRTGFATTPPVLTRDECEQLQALYDSGTFRSRIEMARHRFGEGEYKYFDHPLPELVGSLRRELYPHLAEAANRWRRIAGSGRAIRGWNRGDPVPQQLQERLQDAQDGRDQPVEHREQRPMARLGPSLRPWRTQAPRG